MASTASRRGRMVLACTGLGGSELAWARRARCRRPQTAMATLPTFLPVFARHGAAPFPAACAARGGGRCSPPASPASAPTPSGTTRAPAWSAMSCATCRAVPARRRGGGGGGAPAGPAVVPRPRAASTRSYPLPVAPAGAALAALQGLLAARANRSVVRVTRRADAGALGARRTTSHRAPGAGARGPRQSELPPTARQAAAEPRGASTTMSGS
jgi:hypothetical protein